MPGSAPVCPMPTMQAAGAEIVADADAVYARAELIVKVKEPLPAERKKLRAGQILFTYLHLAPDRAQTEDLMAAGVTAIAYETVTSPHGTLPLLTPMSEVAGRMAPHVGARCLEKENGGRGVLLGGVPGVPPADVVILGGGVAGSHAAFISAGMGATVTVIDRNPEVLRRIANQFGAGVRTVFSTRDAIEALCRRADLVVGSVLVPGAAAPKLITRRDRQGDEARLGHRRHRHRPGRLRRDLASDHAFQPDLPGRRGRALLRDQHAGRGRPHLDLRAQQRDPAVRAGARRQGMAPRARRGSRTCATGSTCTRARSRSARSPRRSS